MQVDLESAEASPLIGNKVSKERNSIRLTYIAFLLIAVLGLVAIVVNNTPSTSAGTSVYHLSEVADAAAEQRLFKLADKNVDNSISSDEVKHSKH